FFQAEDGIRDFHVTGVQTCALPISIFKIGLGGYGTHEYVTEVFEDIFYDFNNGKLTLDQPGNDMVISAEVHNMAKTTIMGQVWKIGRASCRERVEMWVVAVRVIGNK